MNTQSIQPYDLIGTALAQYAARVYWRMRGDEVYAVTVLSHLAPTMRFNKKIEGNTKNTHFRMAALAHALGDLADYIESSPRKAVTD